MKSRWLSSIPKAYEEAATRPASMFRGADVASVVSGPDHGKLTEPVLVIARAGQPPDAFPLREGWSTIGRRPFNDVVLMDEAASRIHAMVRRRGWSASIHDMGSRNGIYVNRIRVRTWQRLVDSDIITIGSVQLHYLTAIGVGSSDVAETDDCFDISS